MKQEEFAPGIPKGRVIHPFPRITEPKQLEFAVHHHKAERAGEHYDLRIGDPRTGRAYSWAMKELPAPGQMTTAVEQPTHTVKYMDFAGEIGEGYGKGQVDLAKRDKVEVLLADDKTIRFNAYPGRGIEEYALRKMKDGGWALQNVTTDRKVGPARDLPSNKPKYKTVVPEKIKPELETTELQAKIDGAHVLYHFKSPGTLARVHSYRASERQGGVIEHTHKLPDYHEHRTPNALRDTIVRGELYAVDSKGEALPAARVGGILNAGVWKSREMQKTDGKLVPIIFDVMQYKGRDVSKLPYGEKKQILSEVSKQAPWLKLPRTATTPEEKMKLISDIRSGKEPSTGEGVIEWDFGKPVPKKTKFHDEHDVYVRRVFAEKGTKRSGTLAGGFEYSKTPRGPIVGRVGTGMTHAMKKDMFENPVKYEGLKARVKAHPAPAHYALRAPALLSLDLEQDLPEGVKTATLEPMLKTAAAPTGEYQGRTMSPDSVKKTVEFQGLSIKIDRPKGFIMRGKDSSGKDWEREYQYDYGYIPKTLGGDGDGLDVFIGPDKNAKDSFWAVQTKQDGSFDEYKVFLGFHTRDEALAAYKAHIPAKLLNGVATIRVEMMKAMLGVEPDGLIKKTAAMMNASFLAELQKIQEARCAG